MKEKNEYFGAKFDQKKPKAGVLLDFGLALLEVAKIGTFGIEKYSRGSWSHVQDGQIRYSDALMRHLLAENQSKFDSDSNLLHAAHAAWNALARLELMLRKEQNKEKKE